jgi:hypothetical protein
MIPLFTQEEYDSSLVSDKLMCQCYYCGSPFKTTKREITYTIKGTKNTAQFCSKKCQGANTRTKIQVNCANCNIKIEKIPAEIKKSKSNNHFCSKSCATTFNNKHKSTGTRRSKLEIYLEQQLPILYPNLEFHFNRKDAIDSELDIYIPSLSLAFELNGIFHYEPIYGSKKLDQIKNNDISKSKACIDNQIDLCIIDTSQFKHFKPLKAQKYVDIIVNIINQRAY